MNLEILKLGFKKFLEDQKIIDADDKDSQLNDISIFTYADEFKEYIESEYKTDSLFSQKNINDILSMEISSDGKLVDKDDNENTDEDLSTGNNILVDLYNELIEIDDFFAKVDKDNSKDISKEEVSQFFNTIKDLDGESEDFSASDILSAASLIKDNEFDKLSVDDSDAQESDIGGKEDDKTTDTAQLSSGGGSYGGGSYGGGSSTSLNKTSGEETDAKKSVSEMSKAELEEESKIAESNVSEKKKSLDDIYSGNNPQLEEIQNNIDSSFEEYTSALEKEDSIMAEKVKEIESKINNEEAKIYKKEQEIKNQEFIVSDLESQYDDSVETVSSLGDTLYQLQNIDDKNFTPDKKQNLEAKISAAQEEYDKAKENRDTLKHKLETEKDNLKGLKDDLSKIEKENVLDDLYKEKTALEGDIAEKYPSIKKLMDEYNENNKLYKTTKDSLIRNTSKELKSEQIYLSEINTQLNITNNKETTKKLSMHQLFESDLEYDIEYVNDGETMPYLLVGPKDADSGEDLPVLIYLHGSGEIKAYDDKMVNGSNKNLLPYNLLANENNFENFNGYIICPVLGGEYGSNWRNENAVNYISNLLDTFSATHKINEDKVALAGHSLGGIGAEYIGYHLSSRFCSIGVLSGYNSGVDISQLDIPVYGFVGQGDSEYMTTTFAQRVGSDKLYIQKGVGHGGVPRSVFLTDSNGNGRSDFFEMLFGDI